MIHLAYPIVGLFFFLLEIQNINYFKTLEVQEGVRDPSKDKGKNEKEIQEPKQVSRTPKQPLPYHPFTFNCCDVNLTCTLVVGINLD